MNIRIKYEKTGVLRFIGHLDVMRLFQKAIRRAKLDVAYSKGFSPHQIISFAAPMPLGMTSEGEYFDGDFVTVTTTEDMMKRLNDTLPDGIKVHDIVILDDNAKNSMSVVSASDYYIYQNEEASEETLKVLCDKVEEFYSQPTIEILKKTKSKEEMSDIKNMILKINKKEDGIYMLLESGSKGNLKPDLVIEAICNYCNISYSRYDYMINRIETYMGEHDNLLPLSAAGRRF